MKFIKNKLIFFLLLIGILYFYFKPKYDDWSELNLLVVKECVKDNIIKERCSVNLKELDFKWDDIYYITEGMQEGYVNNIFGKDIFIRRLSCHYLVFMNKKKIVKVYEQHDDWIATKQIQNTYDKILLLGEYLVKGQLNGDKITHCKNNFFLERVYAYEDFEDNDRIVYSLSCEKLK